MTEEERVQDFMMELQELSDRLGVYIQSNDEPYYYPEITGEGIEGSYALELPEVYDGENVTGYREGTNYRVVNGEPYCGFYITKDGINQIEMQQYATNKTAVSGGVVTEIIEAPGYNFLLGEEIIGKVEKVPEYLEEGYGLGKVIGLYLEAGKSFNEVNQSGNGYSKGVRFYLGNYDLKNELEETVEEYFKGSGVIVENKTNGDGTKTYIIRNNIISRYLESCKGKSEDRGTGEFKRGIEDGMVLGDKLLQR